MVHSYILAFIVPFVTVFFRGLQHKNVIGNHYKIAFFNAYLIVFGEVATVGLIVKNSWDIALPLGTGGACGIIASMYIHNRFVGKKI